MTRQIGVFYKVFYHPARPGGVGRVYNHPIPDDVDVEKYPAIEIVRPILEQRHAGHRLITILAVCRDGPITFTLEADHATA